MKTRTTLRVSLVVLPAVALLLSLSPIGAQTPAAGDRMLVIATHGRGVWTIDVSRIGGR
jgi:hypothetical protein